VVKEAVLLLCVLLACHFIAIAYAEKEGAPNTALSNAYIIITIIVTHLPFTLCYDVVNMS
jgi:hypothetical protein